MKPKLERLEVERAALGNHHLAVDDASPRQRRFERRGELGKIPIERLLVAALNQELVPVAKDENAKAVPFGLEDPTVSVWDSIDAFGQHRQEGGIDREFHAWPRKNEPWNPSGIASGTSAQARTSSVAASSIASADRFSLECAPTVKRMPSSSRCAPGRATKTGSPKPNAGSSNARSSVANRTIDERVAPAV